MPDAEYTSLTPTQPRGAGGRGGASSIKVIEWLTTIRRLIPRDGVTNPTVIQG